MRKNMIFGMIGFVLAVVTCGQALAALGSGEISMGVFSIPLPVDGKDGCTPVITVTPKDDNGCYTTTIQKKSLQSGSCVNDGDEIVRETCDGNGAGGAVNLTEEYVPYPASTLDGAGLQNEGYIKISEDGTIWKKPDYCEEFYEDGLTKKKCRAQGDAAPDSNWLNSDNTHAYQQGEWYIFSVDTVETNYPRLEYVRPVLSGGTSGYPTEPGYTKNVTRYENGREQSDLVAIDSCDKYAKSTDTSDRATKCTVGAPAGTPGATSPYTPGATYCLGDHLSDCNQYTIPVGAVDACAGLTPSDDEWETTVNYSESDYTGPDYNTGCTTNCSGTSGFKTTKEVMCNGNVNVSTQPDRCSYASGGTVQCASGYAYQTCTPGMVAQDGTGTPYSGCFEDTLGGLYARRSEIVPVSLAADTNNLYYCKIADCDSDSTCWIGGNKANGPNPEATACWGTVSITGLTGDAGPGCSFIYNGTKWQTCCWPVTSGGALDTTKSPTCTDVTGDLLNQLNNWMCKPTYTTKYINKKGDGTYEYKSTTDNERTAATVGIRTTITNCDGTNGGDVDVFDGETGNDYNPCDGLTAGSTAALTTVRNTTNVYVPHGNGSNGTTTGIGYYTETNVMCDTSGNKIVKKYDKCDPVSLAAGASRTVGTTTCSGNETLLLCTPQQGSDLTPYPVCSGAEVSGYPKLEYVQPSESNDKFTAEGYTRWVHKYTATGNEVVGDVNQKDSCHPVYKLSRTNSNNTVTATTSSVQKCQIQSPGTTGFTAGEWYCLNTTDNVATSCNGYSDTISDSETSTLKYHLPVMDATSGTTPVAPGWTYTEETDANSVSLRKTDRNKDECKLLTTRTPSGNTTSTTSVWQCTVGAPNGTSGLEEPYTAGAPYCLNYANGICPSNLTDIGAAIDDAADNDPCNGGTSATAVKKVVSRTYTRTTGSQGALTSVYKMCDDTDHTESTADECKEVPTPSGQTCTNGVWMQCTRQADEGTADATARGTTYGYCATYPQCVGNASSLTIVKKTQRSYTVPTKTNSGDTYYTTPGKVTDVKIACNGSTISTAESAEDQCEEIPDTNSICPSDKKVLKTCKRKGDENTTDRKAETTYNLCTAGTSIFSAISDNDPCGGDTTSEAAKKKVKNIQYEYVAASGSGTVGYTKKITSMCNSSESDKEEYIYDTCISVSAAGACNGANDKNYKCYNQTKLTSNNAAEREYNVCNPSSNVSSVALADSVKAQSLFEIWKDQYKNKTETECQLLFGDNKKCGASDNNLTASDMLNSFTAYGVWKEDVVQNATNPSELDQDDLSISAYQNSLKPCERFDISEDAGYDGSQGAGKRYTMTCVE